MYNGECQVNYHSFCFGEIWTKNATTFLANPTHESNKGRTGYMSPENFMKLKNADGMTDFEFPNNAAQTHVKPPICKNANVEC